MSKTVHQTPTGPSSWMTSRYPLHFLVLGLVLLFPLAFAKGMSGNPDDYYYIDAALSWLQDPGYIPQDIRQLRYPHILIIVFFMQFLGMTNASLIMASFVYYILLLAMMYWTVRRISDWRTALWVIYCLALVPIIAAYSTLVLPFASELFFTVAALLLYLHERNQENPKKINILFIGILCGLAFAIRETSGGSAIVGLGLLFLFSPGMNRRWYFLMGAGFVCVWMSETLYFAIHTGDPFYHYHLSLLTFANSLQDNTLLTNHNLQSHSPIFNFELAEAWLPSGLMNLHWTLNPWLNLFFEEDYGLLFYFLLPASWALFKSEPNQMVKQLCKYALSLGMIWFILAYYVFCLMQQPRYVAALPWAAALVIGVWLARLSKQSLPWAMGIALLLAISSLISISSKPDELYKERQLAAMLTQNQEPIHILMPIAQRGSVVLKPFLDNQQLRLTQPAIGDLVFGQPAHWIKKFPSLKTLSWQPAGQIAPEPMLITTLLKTLGILDHLPPFIRNQLVITAPGHPLSRLQPIQ